MAIKNRSKLGKKAPPEKSPAKIKEYRPESLALDLTNPRFGISEAQDESEALRMLVEQANLKELWDSISERGYEKFEPLVATIENGKLVVLEGNRRLAAVKLLLNPDLLGSGSAKKRIPTVSPKFRKTYETVPVIVVSNREDAAGYIGFKHVNGPARWSSLAKAKFGIEFYTSLSGSKSPQEKMTSLTKQLGDSRGLIIRLLVAYKIIRQAVSLGLFETLEIEESSIEFSHLYTLINNPDSRTFIGLAHAPLNEEMIKDNPVPRSHVNNLREVLGWLYGKNSIIKAQGTDRPRLQRVLSNKEAVKELRTTGDLSSAAAVAGLRNEDWIETLASIAALSSKATTDAAVVVPELNTEDSKQAQSIIKRVETQIRQIKSAFSE